MADRTTGEGAGDSTAVAHESRPWSPLARTLARAWWFNWRVGWPERRRLLYGERLPFHSWTRLLPA